MMEINAIIILCACTIGLSLLCPQAHFSPACQRMLGLGAGARGSRWAQMIGHCPSPFPAFPEGVEGQDIVRKGRWREANWPASKQVLGTVAHMAYSAHSTAL